MKRLVAHMEHVLETWSRKPGVEALVALRMPSAPTPALMLANHWNHKYRMEQKTYTRLTNTKLYQRYRYASAESNAAERSEPTMTIALGITDLFAPLGF